MPYEIPDSPPGRQCSSTDRARACGAVPVRAVDRRGSGTGPGFWTVVLARGAPGRPPGLVIRGRPCQRVHPLAGHLAASSPRSRRIGRGRRSTDRAHRRTSTSCALATSRSGPRDTHRPDRGHRFDVRFVQVWTVQDGVVIQIRQYLDSASCYRCSRRPGSGPTMSIPAGPSPPLRRPVGLREDPDCGSISITRPPPASDVRPVRALRSTRARHRPCGAT